MFPSVRNYQVRVPCLSLSPCIREYESFPTILANKKWRSGWTIIFLRPFTFSWHSAWWWYFLRSIALYLIHKACGAIRTLPTWSNWRYADFRLMVLILKLSASQDNYAAYLVILELWQSHPKIYDDIGFVCEAKAQFYNILNQTRWHFIVPTCSCSSLGTEFRNGIITGGLKTWASTIWLNYIHSVIYLLYQSQYSPSIAPEVLTNDFLTFHDLVKVITNGLSARVLNKFIHIVIPNKLNAHISVPSEISS